jgi:hypothetical protein
VKRIPWWRAVPLLLAVPLLGGAGVCGVVLVDIAQRDLILDPVDVIAIESDSGTVEVFSFDRNGVSLFYYMLGSLYDIGDVGHRVDGRTLEVFSECVHEEPYCTINWYAEIMPTTAVEVISNNGPVKLTGIGAPITADVIGGGFDGVALSAPTLDVVVEVGDVNLAYDLPPTSVTVTVGTGNVAVTLPPGTYRCELASADGTVDATDVTCDPMAINVVHIDVETGDIALLPGAMP